MKFLAATSTLLVLLLMPACLQGASETCEEAAGGPRGCAVSNQRLYTIFDELLDQYQEGLTLYVNCLSFSMTGSLESGVISGMNETGGGIRLNISCVDEVLSSKPLNLAPVAQNMTACVACRSNETTNICVEPCRSPCERCYDEPSQCSRCIACTARESELCHLSVTSTNSLQCAPRCSGLSEIQPELFNFCECDRSHLRELRSYALAEKEELKEGEPIPPCESPEVEDFMCVNSCENGRQPNNDSFPNICFACGFPYCVVCDSRIGQCLTCLEHTVLFHGVCYACPLSNTALVAILQEEELEEEEEKQRKHQLVLAIVLPVLSVLIIVFFVGMSIYAHFRYPHIHPAGHKRHRTKPEEIADPIVSDNEGEEGTESVWRARPTVRLR